MSNQRDAGLAALQAGNFQEAASLLEEACRQAPEDFNARQYLAAALQQAGRHLEAAETQIGAVNMQPSNPQARYNLGVIMKSGGYRDEARQAFQQAMQLQPDYPQAAQALAQIDQAASSAPTPSSPPVQDAGQSPYGQVANPMGSGPAAAYAPPSAAQAASMMPQQPAPYGQPAYGQSQTQSADPPASPYSQAQGSYRPPSPYSQAPAGNQPQPAYGQPPAYQSTQVLTPYGQPAGQGYPPAGQVSPYAGAMQPAQQGYGAAPGMQMSRCQVCSTAGPVRSVSYSQNIGLLLMRFTKRIGGEMCEGCASKYFWQMTLTTFALGWFGIISFVVSPFIIIGNTISYVKGAPAAQKLLAICLLLAWLVVFSVLIWAFITSRGSSSDSSYSSGYTGS